MPVGRKLFTAFALVLAAIAVMGVIVVSSLLRIQSSGEQRSIENKANRDTAAGRVLHDPAGERPSRLSAVAGPLLYRARRCAPRQVPGGDAGTARRAARRTRGAGGQGYPGQCDLVCERGPAQRRAYPRGARRRGGQDGRPLRRRRRLCRPAGSRRRRDQGVQRRRPGRRTSGSGRGHPRDDVGRRHRPDRRASDRPGRRVRGPRGPSCVRSSR